MQIPETVFGRGQNPLLYSLLEITQPGGATIWRLLQTAAVWFSGTGAPSAQSGQLSGNLYIDTATSSIYQLGSDGTTWSEIFNGGGGGTITGTIAANQVAVGSGTNAISGSSGLTFTAGNLVVAGHISITGTDVSSLVSLTATANSNQSGFKSILNTAGSTNFIGFTLSGIQIAANHAGTGTCGGIVGLLCTAGSSGGSPGVLTQASAISIAINAAASGVTSANGILIADCQPTNVSSGIALNISGQHGQYLSMSGLTSGAASIGVAAIAGTPNILNLPITTGAAGAFLLTDGNNPQQSSWTSAVTFTGGTFTVVAPVLTNTIAVSAATPTGSAGQVSFGNTAGFGNGSSGTAVTTTTKSTGTGPTTPQTVVNYLEVDIAGTKYWLPLVQ